MSRFVKGAPGTETPASSGPGPRGDGDLTVPCPDSPLREDPPAGGGEEEDAFAAVVLARRASACGLLHNAVGAALGVRDALRGLADDPATPAGDRAVFTLAANVQGQVADALEQRLRALRPSRAAAAEQAPAEGAAAGLAAGHELAGALQRMALRVMREQAEAAGPGGAAVGEGGVAPERVEAIARSLHVGSGRSRAADGLAWEEMPPAYQSQVRLSAVDVLRTAAAHR